MDPTLYYNGPEDIGPETEPSSVSYSEIVPPQVREDLIRQDEEAKKARDVNSTEGLIWANVPGTSTYQFMDPAELMMLRNMDVSAAAINAAQQFQARRGYQKDLAAGTAPHEALAKWLPLMVGGHSASGMGSLLQPDKVWNIGGVGYRQDEQGNMVAVTPSRPSAKIEDLPGGMRRITQPTGHVSEHPIRPPVEQEQKDLHSQVLSAKRALDDAEMDLQAYSQMKTNITPASPGGWFSRGQPAVTNVVPLSVESFTKRDAALAKRNAAQARLNQAQGELQSYLASKGKTLEPAAGTNTPVPVPAPAVAGKPLTKDILRDFYTRANGDRAEALRLAKAAGYTY